MGEIQKGKIERDIEKREIERESVRKRERKIPRQELGTYTETSESERER